MAFHHLDKSSMAGDHNLLKVDPAIERWAHLRENTHLYFAWNKRNVRAALLWMVAVPVGLTYLAYKTDVSVDFDIFSPLLLLEC